MSVTAGLTVLGVMVILGFDSQQRQKFGKLIQPLWVKRWIQASVGLIVALSLSLVWAEIDPVSYSDTSAEVFFPKDVLKFWYFLIPPAILWGISHLNSKQKKNVFRVWMGVIFLFSIVGIFEHFLGWPGYRRLPYLDPPRYSTALFMHHLSISSIFIFSFFASLDQWRLNQSQRVISSKALRILIPLVIFLALFFTYSRMLWAALPVGLLVWVCLYFRSWKSLFAAAAIGLTVLFLVKDLPFLKARWSSNTGINPRLELWQANWQMFKDRPLLGVGFRKNHELSGPKILEMVPGKGHAFAGHAHNMILDLLAGTGILGFIAFILWWWVYFRIAFTLYAHAASDWTGGAAWIAAGVVFLMNGLTQVNFWEGKVLHQLMWVMGWMLVMVNETPGQQKAKKNE